MYSIYMITWEDKVTIGPVQVNTYAFYTEVNDFLFVITKKIRYSQANIGQRLGSFYYSIFMYFEL